MSMTSAVTAGHITPNTSKQKWPVHILLCMTKPASKRKMFFPFAAKEPSQRSELNPIQHIGNQLERRVSQNLSTLNETKSLQLCSNIWWKAFPEAVTVGDTGFGITHTTIDSKCGCPRTFGHVSYIWENLIPLTGLRTVRCSLWSVYWPSSDQTMLVPLIYTEASCPHHISFYITKIIGSWTVASCKNLYILIMLENNLRLSFTALCITVSYDHFYSKI